LGETLLQQMGQKLNRGPGKKKIKKKEGGEIKKEKGTTKHPAQDQGLFC